MRILRKHTATLVRYGVTGVYNEDGEWVETLTPDTTEIRCCIQPDSDPATKIFIPTMVREKKCKLVYTETELKGVSELTDTSADKLIIDGEYYVIFEVAPWNGAGRIRAWMAICVREDEI